MSDVSVDIIKNRSGEAPDLPSGANLSGVSTAATLQVTNLNPTHINASGVTTATTFSGSLKSTGTPTLGLGVTINSSGLNISGVATAGIVSATTLFGDGSGLTGVAMSIAPISYNPDVSDSTVPKASGIGLTFTERVIAGSGNVTLRIAGAAGTVVENFGVGSSVTISNNNVSIDPTSDLTAGETYHISYPSGAFTNTAGDLSYVGTAYTFGVKPEFRSLWAWGFNNQGQLGQNSVVNYSSPVQIGTDTNWRDLPNMNATYYLSQTATKTDGTLWAWGNNNSGGLGQNQAWAQLGALSSPTQIPGTTWAIGGSDQHQVYTKTDGTLWVWGDNDYGQLGQNSVVKYSSPVQVPGTTWPTSNSNGIKLFASGYASQNTALIKTDGTLWVWGRNYAGELGQNQGNQNSHYSSPVQIPGTTWKHISFGNYQMFATKTDGTAWGWGLNSNGSLGQNNTTNRSSPIQIGSDTTWDVIYNADEMSYAIKTDGTLWSWGNNESGALGHNQSNNNASSPVQVPGTTWSSTPLTFSAAQFVQSTILMKTDGTLWGIGGNTYGHLGQNNTTARSSPVQIPGTDWNQAQVSGAAHVVAIKVT